jgi:hypothetical protein
MVIGVGSIGLLYFMVDLVRRGAQRDLFDTIPLAIQQAIRLMERGLVDSGLTISHCFFPD